MGWAAKVLRFIWQNKGWIIPVVAEAYNVVSKWIRDKKDDTPDSDVNNDTPDSDERDGAQVNSNDNDNTTGVKHSGTASGKPDQNGLDNKDSGNGINPLSGNGDPDKVEPRNQINTVIFPI